MSMDHLLIRKIVYTILKNDIRSEILQSQKRTRKMHDKKPRNRLLDMLEDANKR